MTKKKILPLILTILGLLLVGGPVLLPIFGALGSLGRAPKFMFDFLLPMEVFPVPLVGGILLLVAALVARRQRKLVGWSLGFMVGSLLATMAFAMLSGLASGRVEMEGIYLVVGIILLVIFWAAMVALLVGGVLLLVNLFQKQDG